MFLVVIQLIRFLAFLRPNLFLCERNGQDTKTNAKKKQKLYRKVMSETKLKFLCFCHICKKTFIEENSCTNKIFILF
jgi:hypothetical protein